MYLPFVFICSSLNTAKYVPFFYYCLKPSAEVFNRGDVLSGFNVFEGKAGEVRFFLDKVERQDLSAGFFCGFSGVLGRTFFVEHKRLFLILFGSTIILIFHLGYAGPGACRFLIWYYLLLLMFTSADIKYLGLKSKVLDPPLE